MKKTEYMGYTVQVDPQQDDGLWTSHIQVFPKYETKTSGLVDMYVIPGDSSEEDAEEAGRHWGERRIERHRATGR